jgi:hypothetical protein
MAEPAQPAVEQRIFQHVAVVAQLEQRVLAVLLFLRGRQQLGGREPMSGRPPATWARAGVGGTS